MATNSPFGESFYLDCAERRDGIPLVESLAPYPKLVRKGLDASHGRCRALDWIYHMFRHDPFIIVINLIVKRYGVNFLLTPL